DESGAAIENMWTLESSPLPPMSAEAREIRRSEELAAGWRDGETIFMVVAADQDENTGRDLRKMTGTVSRNESDQWVANWSNLESETRPSFRQREDGTVDVGLFGDYAGASMTAYAFDRVTPGLGMYLVTVAAWLFALSTMISWSYYGEQGVYYFFGTHGEKAAKPAVFLYKIIYSLLILLTCILAMPIFGADGDRAIIGTDSELDMWTTLGLGVMLVANIPIMWIFGAKAMGAYHGYFRKIKGGGDDAHDAPPITDVVEGKDVE
ncbi:MAG: alanine:cation symporter family protein, partial [Planctomycetota bacterium]